MKKSVGSIFIVLIVLAASLPAYAVTTYFYLYNWEGAMKDTDGSLIAAGSRVEFIWTGANGIIDPVQTDSILPGYLGVGGDDVLVEDFAVGDGIPRTVPAGYYNGHIDGYIANLELNNFTDFGSTLSPYDDNFYVRFYTAADPVAALSATNFIAWGESEVFQITAPNTFGFSDDINFGPDDLFITNSITIPEPLSILMLAVACCGIKLFHRRK